MRAFLPIDQAKWGAEFSEGYWRSRRAGRTLLRGRAPGSRVLSDSYRSDISLKFGLMDLCLGFFGVFFWRRVLDALGRTRKVLRIVNAEGAVHQIPLPPEHCMKFRVQISFNAQRVTGQIIGQASRLFQCRQLIADQSLELELRTQR